MFTRRLRTEVVAVALVIGGLIFGPSWPAGADAADISVGGVWVCKITQGASGYTAEQRAVEVRKRITEVLSVPEFRHGVVVSVRSEGGAGLVLVGDRLVLTVTSEDAIKASVTAVELARQWAQRLALGLSHALPDPDVHVF